MEKVSVVIPTYNRAQRIEAWVSSIVSQTYRPIELIVVDDGADDDTATRLNSVKDTLRESGIDASFHSIPHSGQDAAMSEGLKHITGDYFFWCDDDDILTPDAVSSKVGWLRDHPDYDFVRCDAVYVEEESEKILGRAYSDERLKCHDILEHLLDDTMPPLAGTYMMRTSLLDRIYRERSIPNNGEGQNLQLLIPAALISRCGYIDRVGLLYSIHGDSHSHQSRSLSGMLDRNERFRELKLSLLGSRKAEFSEVVNKTHDTARKQLLKQAAQKARRERGEKAANLAP